MKTERMLKLKSATLAFIMLTFAVVLVLGGVAIGQEQTDDECTISNIECPVLEISKTIISGDTVVPIRTQVFWELEIRVTNTGDTALDDGIVKDTLPAYIGLISTTESAGSVTTTTKNGATRIIWAIGVLAPGATETLTMEIVTKTESGGRRMGMTNQYFQGAGEYVLNEGAFVSGTHQTGTIIAGPTDPITVYAEYKHMGRMGHMGGMGGRWR